MEPEKPTFPSPPAPRGAYLDAAFLCVLFAVPFFYLLLPAFLPSAASVPRVALFVPPLAVLLITSSIVLFSSPEIPARQKFGLPSGSPFPWKTVFSYWLFLYVLLILVSGAVKSLADRFGLPLPEQEVVRQLADSNMAEKALIIVSAVLIAPVAEEFVFRHIFFSGAAYGIGTGPAAVLTAALFSALHANLLQAPSLFFMSLILQAAYRRTGRLTVPILIHSLFNAVSVILILLIRTRS